MKPQIRTTQPGSHAGARVSHPEERRVASPTAMSEQETVVLECLRVSRSAITAKQLQARVSCDAAGSEQTLVALIERGFVTRLNTIIPSYLYRWQSRRVETE